MQPAVKLLAAIITMSAENKMLFQMSEEEKQEYIKQIKDIRDTADELLKELEKND
jgi:hypothetical protein